MPVALRQHINASLEIEVWHFTESEAFFLSALPLSARQRQEIGQLHLSERRLEKLACRMALTDLIKGKCPSVSISGLCRSPSGAPLLPPYRISFAHCSRYAAAALSTDPAAAVGIDIEPVGQRILKLYPAFLNRDEQRDCNCRSPEELHYYWGAKEAVFKACGSTETEMPPLKDIRINRREKSATLTVHGCERRYLLAGLQVGGNMVVVAFTGLSRA